MSIPKIIHYCWFGGKELPKSAKKCIRSWQKYMPDYEIKRWDESNFDINLCKFTTEAYSKGKYAFVSDVARFWILNKYGGVYFDTDVEVIRPFDDIVNEGPFMGLELPYNASSFAHEIGIAPGLGMGAVPEMPFYGEMLDFYSKSSFINDDGSLNLTPIGKYVSRLLCAHGLENKKGIQTVADINIYPNDYFCPKSITNGKITLTQNSHSIHHFDASWLPRGKRMKIIMSVRYPKLTKKLLAIKSILSGKK